MTRPGTEPRSPGPLANILTAKPMSEPKKHQKTIISNNRLRDDRNMNIFKSRLRSNLVNHEFTLG